MVFAFMNQEEQRSDSALLESYKSGDSKAFEELYDRHAQPVLTYVLNMLQDRDRAEDVVQEVFVSLIRNLNTLPSDVHLRSYLMTGGRNRVYNQWRDLGRNTSAMKKYAVFEKVRRIPESLAGQDLEAEELCSRLNSALEKLGVDEREIVLLHAYSELTFERVAEVTQTPIGTVATRYRRAMEKLKTEINRNGKEQEPETNENRDG